MINKILILCSLLFLFTANAFAKDYNILFNDTIRLQMPNGTTIEHIKYHDKKNDSISVDFNVLFTSFLNHWKVLDFKGTTSNRALCIKFTDGQRYYSQNVITIDERLLTKVISFHKDTILALAITGKNKLDLDSKFTIYFDHFDQLEEFENYNLNTIITNINQQIPNRIWFDTGQYSYTSWFNVHANNSVELINRQITGPNKYYKIKYIAGTSLENVKGNWNGSFNARLSFSKSKNGLLKHNFSIEYEWMYDFSSGKENINHWVSLGYAENITNDPNKPNWFGISLGYLAKQNGDLFEKDSFRFGIEKKIHKSISIVPQIYFNDFFKDSYPGFKIKIHL